MNSADAKKRVKTMGIVAAVLLGIQVIFLLAIVTLGQSILPGLDLWSVIDVFIGCALVVWLLVKKSRTGGGGITGSVYPRAGDDAIHCAESYNRLLDWPTDDGGHYLIHLCSRGSRGLRLSSVEEAGGSRKGVGVSCLLDFDTL